MAVSVGTAPSTVVLRWLAVQPDDPAAADWYSVLDPAEQLQASRFHFSADRLVYVAAHALLRRMLTDAAGLPPQSWRFHTSAGGKPFIDPALGQQALRCNISHTRGMVACAVGWRHELGVDIEPVHHSRPVLELAQRFFAPAEAALLEPLPPAMRGVAFSRLWTLKEAYLKATGEGLQQPLDSFAFSLDPVAIRFREPLTDDAAAWRFFECRADGGYCVALAVRRPKGEAVSLDAGPV